MALIDQSDPPQDTDARPSGDGAATATEKENCGREGAGRGEPCGSSPPSLSASFPDRLQHWFLLVGSTMVILLSFVLHLGESGRVVLPAVDRPLPGICTFRRLTGLPCPGCGLTRSFVSIGHGDFPAAWRFNPAGLLVFIVVASQIPYRVVQLWRIHCGRPELSSHTLAHCVVWIMVVALVGQWLVRLLWEVLPRWS